MEEREQERLKATIARLEKETAVQKRELEMEAALEKVRSAANAMQTSDELLNVITIVGQQLEKLGLEFDSTNFRTNVGEKDWRLWIYAKWMDQPRQWFIPQIDHPYFSMYEKEGEVVSHVFSREEKDSFEAYLFQLGLIEIPKDPDVAAKQKEFMEAAQGFAWSIASIKSVSLNIANSRAKPYTQEENALLLRFTIAFEQAYTRFLDLQKAESQSREAQIELGLERVRARAMAMQHSEELKDLIDTVFTELTRLDIVLTRCLLMIYDPATKGSRWWMANSETQNEPIGLFVQYHEHPPYLAYLKAWEAKTIRWQYNLQGQIKKDWDDFLFNKTELSHLPDFVIAGMKAPDSVILSASFNNFGNLTLATLEPLSEEHSDILLRFAKVFDLTYTRFNDLQKAEAQSREAQVELALERVRARTMAMQRSDELLETSMLLFKQLRELGETADQVSIGIINEEEGIFEVSATVYGNQMLQTHKPRLDEPYALGKVYQAWKKKQKNIVIELAGEVFKNYNIYRNNMMDTKVFNEEIMPGDRWIVCAVCFSKGALLFSSAKEVTKERLQLLERFAGVFEQTYTRFLDLQKAEAQAREAQIEAALERVRSQSMAMHKSNDLLEVINVLSNQLLHLGFKVDSANFNTSYREKDWNLWLCNPGRPMYPDKIHIPYFDHPYFNLTLESLAKGSDFNSFVFNKEEKDSFLDHLFSNTIAKNTQEEIKKMLYSKQGFAWSAVYLKNTCITIANYDAEPYTEAHNVILRRFGNVFEQSYTRFLDLQKAETQAKEALIEAGLERVRYSAMAMQSSEDVGSATAVVFTEISLLGVEAMRCGITIIHPDKKADVWAATTTSEGKEMKGMGSINFNNHPLWVGLFNAWRNKEENFTYELKGEDLKSYYKILTHSPGYNSSYIQNQEYPDHVFYASLFEQGAVFTFSLQPHNDEKRKILKRFTAVFSLTFRRYLDLKQAEAQAREAEIQLVLERVRARTMAMQRSEELAETCELLFEEFRKLRLVKTGQEGTAGDRTTIGIFNEAEGTYDLSITNLEGKKLDQTFHLSIKEPVNIAKVYAAWKKGKPLLVIDMQGDDLKRWFNYLESIGLPINHNLYNKRRVNTYAFFSKGTLGISTNETLPEESLLLLQRFADTFNLTYTRFQDLKDAEARTQIAVKEASLDRVRAEIASMRTAEDLQHITPLVWRELTALGVPFFRCGVFIVDDEKQLIHFYLSAPDGKPLAALELGFESSDITKNATIHWRKQKVYIAHWTKEEFLQFAQDLIVQGQIQNVQTYQGGEDAPESLTLQFVPFAQGMMYVGSIEDLSAAQIELVQLLADAFSTAYARYEDFNKLEAAKQQIESTLKDLRATQTQLIQSEKMASLGELTAGIAHEIQNPLNFVNNFSEVSTELVDEMNEEIERGNLEDAKQISQDLKDNLSKINHHGKRAGDIVRGMLQHSRSSSGQKEAADINALADEYLRLAYHGLRAKDKSFNATMVTDFDPAIDKINIVPQDIGRVVLNLITNAFYAVNDKKKKGIEGYEPTVTVSTGLASASGNPLIRQFANSIIISVKDNGMGIPEKVKEKIFQPFFTTKPTGEGTGLGLSMSYDIVTKGHGGELMVSSAEGEYAEFSIVLPA